MEKYEVVIVGGGISGLSCAIALARKGKKVCIVERDNKIGKKFLVTGNGRCNLSNVSVNIDKYNTRKVEEVFKEIDNETFNSFLDSLSIVTYHDDEGRIYPISDSAECVRKCFSYELDKLGVDKFLEQEVVNIEKNAKNFIIYTKNMSFMCENCVIAMGGNFNKDIFKNLDLELEDSKTTLVGYKCFSYDKKLFGVRNNCKVKINYKNYTFEEFGQVQFKEDGISGIVILNASVFAEKLNLEKFDITLDLLPSLSQSEIEDILISRKNKFNHFNAKDLLISLLPQKLAENVIKKCLSNSDKISDKKIKEIAFLIKNYTLNVVDKYNNPQVYYGGVSIEKLDKLKDKSGLYFTGECASVYGYCGGYNIHWAIISGLYVAKVI